MFPDTVDKLPEMTDQQPLYVESTVLRQLPHNANFAWRQTGLMQIAEALIDFRTR
jgi:hypothetical protein